MDTMEEPGLLDMDALSRSINGFEQIAIRRMFRERLDALSADGVMLMRAFLFVVEKRNGMSDPDAYRAAMNMTIEEVVARFPQDDGSEPEDEDAVAERDRQYADFVVGIGLSFTVEQYMALTVGQKNALIDAANRRH